MNGFFEMSNTIKLNDQLNAIYVWTGVSTVGIWN